MDNRYNKKFIFYLKIHREACGGLYTKMAMMVNYLLVRLFVMHIFWFLLTSIFALFYGE